MKVEQGARSGRCVALCDSGRFVPEKLLYDAWHENCNRPTVYHYGEWKSEENHIIRRLMCFIKLYDEKFDGRHRIRSFDERLGCPSRDWPRNVWISEYAERPFVKYLYSRNSCLYGGVNRLLDILNSNDQIFEVYHFDIDELQIFSQHILDYYSNEDVFPGVEKLATSPYGATAKREKMIFRLKLVRCFIHEKFELVQKDRRLTVLTVKPPDDGSTVEERCYMAYWRKVWEEVKWRIGE